MRGDMVSLIVKDMIMTVFFLMFFKVAVRIWGVVVVGVRWRGLVGGSEFGQHF